MFLSPKRHPIVEILLNIIETPIPNGHIDAIAQLHSIVILVHLKKYKTFADCSI